MFVAKLAFGGENKSQFVDIIWGQLSKSQDKNLQVVCPSANQQAPVVIQCILRAK